MKFSNLFDNLSVEEQKGVALFLCNAFSSVKGSEWVMYASTWPLTEDTETSNVRVAAKVAGQFQTLCLVFNVVVFSITFEYFCLKESFNISVLDLKINKKFKRLFCSIKKHF